jgi:hypothetical protein
MPSIGVLSRVSPSTYKSTPRGPQGTGRLTDSPAFVNVTLVIPRVANPAALLEAILSSLSG